MKSNAVLKQPDWEVITTHVLDRHNDYIQISARQQDGGVGHKEIGSRIPAQAQDGAVGDHKDQLMCDHGPARKLAGGIRLGHGYASESHKG